MASTTLVSPPIELARSAAVAMPRDLSKSPLLGILGAIIGAGVVTLTGRMISLGLADLKGNIGIGFDDGAWVSSAYNIALMFIGPFTVYVGALLGPRRILFIAATSFTVICFFTPFIHSYSLLITAMVLAGLTSGTFYPLTLTFALRNIPLRFLPFTIALYATFVDGAVNVAPSLYGWYREHLSWHWMFWNSALITPFMMFCIYFGIPKPAAAAKKSGTPPSFAGFLYWSAGLAMLYAAIAVHVVNMTAPQIFRPVSVVWLWFSELLGAAVSKIVMGIVFFGVVTPMGLWRRMTGKDSLKLRAFKAGAESVMCERNHMFIAKDLETPY